MWEFDEDPFPSDLAPQLLQIFVRRDGAEASWIYLVTNLSVAAALFAIVVVLIVVVRKRKDFQLRGVFILLMLFLGLRGVIQLLGVWTILHPGYLLDWKFRAVTAVLGVITAAALIRMVPVLRRIPSISDLEKEIQVRQRAEEEAREKEELFRNFIEGIHDYAMYMIDPQGIVQTWNTGAKRIKGYEAEEIIGGHFSCFYTAEDIAKGLPEEAIRLAAETGRHESEGWRVRKDGSRFRGRVTMTALRNASGDLVGFSKFTRDVSELHAVETRYQTLLESAPDAILIVNAGGKVEFANRRVEDLFGYHPQDLLGQPVEILVPLELQAAHVAHRAEFLATPRLREMGADLDLMAVRRDGTRFPVEISLSPLQGPDGTSVTAAIRDITVRRSITRQLDEKMAELRHSNEALEQFAHVASHDLQEPLRMVASYVQLLSRRYKGKLDSEADEFIGFAVDGTRRMKILIEDLLLYSRAAKTSPAAVEVPAEKALKLALKNLQSAIEETEASVTHGELPLLAADQPQIVQLFQNLVGNAIKYRGQRVPKIHITALAQNGEWVFSVADNGIGIDPIYFDRIFEIFQRLHGREEYEGTGIGLAICKRILHNQGGRIWVESQPGQGSIFHFALPMRG